MKPKCVCCGGLLHGKQSLYCSQKCLHRVRRRNPEKRERILANRKSRRQTTEVKEREAAYARAYRERPEVRDHYAAYMEAYWKEYRERPGKLEHRSLVSTLYRRRPDVAARLKASKKAYRDRPENRDRQTAYFAANVVQVNSMYFHRKKDSAELIAVAERIKETKALLRKPKETT